MYYQDDFQHQLGAYNEPTLQTGSNEEPPFDEQYFQFQNSRDQIINDDQIYQALPQHTSQDRSFQSN